MSIASGRVSVATSSDASTSSQEGLPRRTRRSSLPAGCVDVDYEAKALVLNDALQEIGMGKYQWGLWIVVGFGYAGDNLWPVLTSLIFTAVAHEFLPEHPPLLVLAQNAGLVVGAAFWGFGSDFFGRKFAFNLTLGMTALFGILAAFSPNFVGIGCFVFLYSFGVGGNQVVDSAVFLEFVPPSHEFLVTILSFYWSFAQVLVNLIAWPLLGNFTCGEQELVCTRSKNMGWRYLVFTVGAIWLILFILRFLFPLYESPKYLMGRGRIAEAVRVVHAVAKKNGTTSALTDAHLEQVEVEGGGRASAEPDNRRQVAKSEGMRMVKKRLENINFSYVRALFTTPQMAFSTSLIILVWALIGLAFPLYNAFLPYIQATRGAAFGDGSTYLTYRNSLIIATLGIPGALLGGLMVEMSYLGRKGTLALSTALTGAFLICSTTALSSTALLGWNCAYSFCSSIMYGVLYSYTPQIFPTHRRGTGNALTACANRIFGLSAPLIAIYADPSTAVPVYVSGGLFLLAALFVIMLPFESRGKASI